MDSIIIMVAAVKTATTAMFTTTVPYKDTDCSLKDTIGHKVEQNLQPLPCVQQGICHIDVKSKCDFTASNRRKRSGGSVSVTVNMTANFSDSVTWGQSKLTNSDALFPSPSLSLSLSLTLLRHGSYGLWKFGDDLPFSTPWMSVKNE